ERNHHHRDGDKDKGIGKPALRPGREADGHPDHHAFLMDRAGGGCNGARRGHLSPPRAFRQGLQGFRHLAGWLMLICIRMVLLILINSKTVAPMRPCNRDPVSVAPCCRRREANASDDMAPQVSSRPQMAIEL